MPVVVDDITQLIGDTPLLRLKRLFPDHAMYGKCEFLNPLSLKDRPILQIFQDAEDQGQLNRGDTVIECTSGNTGMAVAYIAAIRGYHAILVMSEIQSLERRQVLQALGAELILTPASLGTAGARKRLKEIRADHPEYFYVGQHTNPSNPHAHYLTTGPEIWNATKGKIDVLVAGLGTGGTLCGSGRYLKEKNPNIELIAIEPANAPFISQGIFNPHRIMGTAPGFYPETLDREVLDEILLIEEEDAFTMCRELAKKEGILVGISSGAVCHIARTLFNRDGYAQKTIVGILADTGQRYLSVEGLFT